MSLRRQGVVVAMLAGVSALAVVTAFVLLARFQAVPVRLPAGIEASSGPVASVEVAPDLHGPAAPAEAPPGGSASATGSHAANPAGSESSCEDDPPAPG